MIWFWLSIFIAQLLVLGATFAAGAVYGRQEAAKGLQLIHQVLAKIESKL